MEYVKRPLMAAAMILAFSSAAADAYAQERKKPEEKSYFSSSFRIVPTNRGIAVINHDGTARHYTSPLTGLSIKVTPRRSGVAVSVSTEKRNYGAVYSGQTLRSFSQDIQNKLKDLKGRGFVFKLIP